MTAFNINSVDLDELVIAYLAESYSTCYWCYMQDIDRAEPHKVEDRLEYLKTLAYLSGVLEYIAGTNRAEEIVNKVTSNISSKHKIMKGMSNRE